MPSPSCPVCDERFDSPGAAQSHAWDAHSACHHCGQQFESGDETDLYRHWLTAHDEELTRIERKRAESAVGSPTFSDRLSNGGVGAAVGGLSRRSLLVGGGTVAVAGLALGGVALTDGASNDDGDGDGGGSASSVPDGPVATAQVPSAPGDRRYATMGSDDAAVNVTYFGNWKCPYCADFSTGFLADLVTDYVATGDVSLTYRNLTYVNGGPFLGSDTPAAARAGLAVWNEDPESYWRYHEYVMANQPPESDQWATADRLVEFATRAEVSDPSVVRTAVEENRYEEALRATTAAANEAGVSGTPTLVVGGRTVSPFQEDQTRSVIESAVSN
ncbi:DsbA family protein [Candidatus Halobonum tyrrellensis]|uniref:DSBA-like thioredoxin n=1 Tax=Candidatus Halobonum tyrrellensis G22 TaxID=1324957 RepID=V4HHB4_9EURY|nr:DsbA family protein [Candidatus Halobonum tyrrellensis]ESP87259.1 DSBA-like thioredoxin [Candidatus Halobonum tyrrellensis G22]